MLAPDKIKQHSIFSSCFLNLRSNLSLTAVLLNLHFSRTFPQAIFIILYQHPMRHFLIIVIIPERIIQIFLIDQSRGVLIAQIQFILMQIKFGLVFF